MIVHEKIDSIQTLISAWRKAGDRIAFVPTMGNLHAGHLALVKQGFELADRVVASIFVNPLQFAEDEDLSTYPRTLEQDSEKLEGLGVDCLFTPDVDTLYPKDNDTSIVDVGDLSNILCGEHRIGHFSGVTTVVSRLFDIVQPDLAIFGEKDFQQLTIIRRMVDLLHLSVKIIAVATKRESDGLAMSSRNGYLSEQQRRQAPLLYQCLQDAVQAIRGGENVTNIEKKMGIRLAEAGFVPEYFTLRDSSTLEECVTITDDCRILVAARLGDTRLIDNIRVN